VSAELCAACGLCCDGTLHGRVVVDTAEAEQLTRLRLPLVDDGSAPALPQPCAAHASGGCTVYAHRPSACAVYECEVYRQLGRGEIAPAAALARVADARRLAEAVRALLPGHERRPLVDALATVLAGVGDGIGDRRAHAELLLAAASLTAACRALDPRFGRVRDTTLPEEAG
jgi:Fe-S-cluster containining protein